jgi:hypothetical protein
MRSVPGGFDLEGISIGKLLASRGDLTVFIFEIVI